MNVEVNILALGLILIVIIFKIRLDAENKIASAMNESVRLRQLTSELQQELNELKDSSSAVEKVLQTKLKSKEDTIHMENERLRSQVISNQKTISHLQTSNRLLDNELSSLIQKHDSLSDRHTVLQDVTHDKEQELNAEIERLKDELLLLNTALIS